MPAVRRLLRFTLLAALLHAGCGSSDDRDGGDGGAIVPGCAGAPFGAAQPLDGIVGNADDPSATSDSLELWFARSGIVPTYDIEGARRASTSSAFDTPVDFTQNATASDRDPQLTADGLAIAFLSERDGGWQVYEARRSSSAAAFEAPTRIDLPTGSADGGIELSGDGLTLYITDATGDLRATTRTARGAAFGAPSGVLASGVQFPTLSADQLELYYGRTDMVGVFRRTRASTTIAFDKNETLVVADASEPDLAPDSERLYVKLGSFAVLTRSCD